jgi:hypothetical protein
MSLCLTNYALRHEDVWCSRCMDPQCFDLDSSWRWVSGQLHSQAALPGGKEPLYTLRTRWVPEPIWTTWRKENSWHYRDSNFDPSVVQPVISCSTDCATAAPSVPSGANILKIIIPEIHVTTHKRKRLKVEKLRICRTNFPLQLLYCCASSYE